MSPARVKLRVIPIDLHSILLTCTIGEINSSAIGPKSCILKTYPVAGPVAQSVEHQTPRGERTRPGKRGTGFEARRVLDVYEHPGGYGYG